MTENLTVVYDTVLGVPKMEEEVKATFKLTRKEILLVSQLIDEGLSNAHLMEIFPEDSFKGVQAMQKQLLIQGKFSEQFVDNWKTLIAKLVGRPLLTEVTTNALEASAVR